MSSSAPSCTLWKVAATPCGKAMGKQFHSSPLFFFVECFFSVTRISYKNADTSPPLRTLRRRPASAGEGYRASLPGLWCRCASATGRARSTASTCADTTTLSRLSRGPSAVASIPAGSRCGGSYETPFAESGSPTLGSVVVRRTAGAGYPIEVHPSTHAPVRTFWPSGCILQLPSRTAQ